MKVTQLCLTLSDPMDYTGHEILQNTGVGSLSLLQGIFPTQGSSPGLLHCRQILYQLSHKGSPKCVYTVPNIKTDINTITLYIYNYLYLHKVPSHNLVHFNFAVIQ